MYPLIFHKTLTPERWTTFPRDRQLLMIGNELNRLLNGIGSGQSLAELQSCMERIFELLDLTIEVNDGHFRKELLRWRELFAAFYSLDAEAIGVARESLSALLRALLLLNSKSAVICLT